MNALQKVDDITRMRRKKQGQCPEHGNDLVARIVLPDLTITWACDSGLWGNPHCNYKVKD